MSSSTFDRNEAMFGGGIATDCVAEVCVGDLPRDSCATRATDVSSSRFLSNVAINGGGIHADNVAVSVASAGSNFTGNYAVYGASAFSDNGGVVTVDGQSLADAQAALTAVSGANTVADAGYGQGIASPPTEILWAVAPAVSAPVMSGTNLCAGNGGCRLSMGDLYGNTPTVAEVVEVMSSAVVDGPQFVLVSSGESGPIASLSLRQRVDTSLMALPATTVETIELRFAGGLVPASDSLVVTSTHCGAGFGSIVYTDEAAAVSCEPCQAGTFSDEASWEACLPCPDGYSTEPNAEGAETCAWCDAGYGWDAETETCEPCPMGTFASDPSLEVPCAPCEAGLTTVSAGAAACTSAIDAVGFGSTPWWIWAVIAGGVFCLVACVGCCAWRYSRRKVISNYYIGVSLDVCL